MAKKIVDKIFFIVLISFYTFLIASFYNITWKENIQFLFLLIVLFLFRKKYSISIKIAMLTTIFISSQVFDTMSSLFLSGIISYNHYFFVLKIILTILFLIILCFYIFYYRKYSLKYLLLSGPILYYFLMRQG